jgi:site-specific recombinase XerD
LPEYKHGKQTEPIMFSQFQEAMEKGYFVKPLRDKSLLAFLYWFGVRRTEAIDRVVSDFNVEDGFLIVRCPAKKRGRRKVLKAPTNLPYIHLILKQVENARKKGRRKVWDVCSTIAWYVVKRSMGEKYYPHFFRLNRAVNFLDDPTTTIPEMQAWFGWRTVDAINSYLGYSQRHLDKQASRLKNDLEK